VIFGLLISHSVRRTEMLNEDVFRFWRFSFCPKNGYFHWFWSLFNFLGDMGKAWFVTSVKFSAVQNSARLSLDIVPSYSDISFALESS